MVGWFNNYWGLLPLDLSRMSKKKLNQFANEEQFLIEFDKLFTLAMNTFKWNNLPASVDSRWLERSFILTGKAMIVIDQGGYLALAGGANSALNVNGYPIRAFGWGANGYNKQFNLYVRGADEQIETRRAAGSDLQKLDTVIDGVLGYDSSTAFPPIHHIVAQARRMADTMRSLDTCAINLKTPYIISTEESQINSVKEAFKQREDNMPAILGSGGMGIDSIKVWPAGTDPGIMAVLWEHRENLEGEIREQWGQQSNPESNKRERMLVDEVNSNNEATQDSVYKRLEWRRRFCEDVNECFGLDISVELNNQSEEYKDTFGIEDPVEDGGDPNALAE